MRRYIERVATLAADGDCDLLDDLLQEGTIAVWEFRCHARVVDGVRHRGERSAILYRLYWFLQKEGRRGITGWPDVELTPVSPTGTRHPMRRTRQRSSRIRRLHLGDAAQRKGRLSRCRVRRRAAVKEVPPMSGESTGAGGSDD